MGRGLVSSFIFCICAGPRGYLAGRAGNGITYHAQDIQETVLCAYEMSGVEYGRGKKKGRERKGKRYEGRDFELIV